MPEGNKSRVPGDGLELNYIRTYLTFKSTSTTPFREALSRIFERAYTSIGSLYQGGMS